MRKLLRHRDARLYLAGQSLSIAGDNALWLAMGIYVKILTGSSSAAGLTFFAYACGSILAPASGLLADRLRRRPLLAAANLAGAALVCGLLAAGPGRVWLIYAVMFGYGAVGSLISAAQTALVAVIVPADLLGEANAVLGAAQIGLRVLTPLAGAGLLALAGPAPVIALDAATFAVAALSVIALRVREPAPARPGDRPLLPAGPGQPGQPGQPGGTGGTGKTSGTDETNGIGETSGTGGTGGTIGDLVPAGAAGRLRAELTAGMRHLVRVPELRRLLLAGVVALLAFGFFETVPFAVVSQGLGRPPAFLGVLETGMGAGALAAAATAAAVMRRVGERGLVAAGLITSAAACLLMLSHSLPAVLAGMAVEGADIVWVNVGAVTMLQRLTPQGLLGRAEAALNLGVLVPQVLSIALGAALLSVLGYRVLLVIMTVVLAAAGTPLLRPGRVRAAAGVSLAPPRLPS
jgi:Na+/melibiose symporter-like transporter